MTPESFVAALATFCRDGAVSDCVQLLTDPPGRKPEPELVCLSGWFKGLPEIERSRVITAMRMAADSTLIGVLCVLDGVRPVEGGEEKSVFQLTAIRGREASTLVPSEELLHDIYRGEF